MELRQVENVLSYLRRRWRRSCALKDKEEGAISSLRDVNVDELEGTLKKVSCFGQAGRFHLMEPSPSQLETVQRVDLVANSNTQLCEEAVNLTSQPGGPPCSAL